MDHARGYGDGSEMGGEAAAMRFATAGAEKGGSTCDPPEGSGELGVQEPLPKRSRIDRVPSMTNNAVDNK